MTPQTKAYGIVSWFERLSFVFKLLPLPAVTLFRLLQHCLLSSGRWKSWRRVLTDTSFRYISSSLSVNQMQSIMGTTLNVYTQWAKKIKLPIVVDEIGEDARLLWIGQRETDNVILYIHGGVYCLPLQDIAASFWKYAVETMQKDTNKKIGFAALNYSLTPTAYFPTQLKQTVTALNHLISHYGVRPENIQIAGESAGGALVLQVLSHMLHPVPDVPLLPGDLKLGGACIMSPWVSLTGDTGSHLENSDSDVLPARTWTYLGQHTLPSLNEDSRPYLQALDSPERWFDGVHNHVRRVLMTVGEKECLRDDVIEVSKKIKGSSESFLTVVVQKNGVHNDQYLDFMAGEKNLGELTPQLIHWLEKGLN